MFQNYKIPNLRFKIIKILNKMFHKIKNQKRMIKMKIKMKMIKYHKQYLIKKKRMKFNL